MFLFQSKKTLQYVKMCVQERLADCLCNLPSHFQKSKQNLPSIRFLCPWISFAWLSLCFFKSSAYWARNISITLLASAKSSSKPSIFTRVACPTFARCWLSIAFLNSLSNRKLSAMYSKQARKISSKYCCESRLSLVLSKKKRQAVTKR